MCEHFSNGVFRGLSGCTFIQGKSCLLGSRRERVSVYGLVREPVARAALKVELNPEETSVLRAWRSGGAGDGVSVVHARRRKKSIQPAPPSRGLVRRAVPPAASAGVPSATVPHAAVPHAARGPPVRHAAAQSAAVPHASTALRERCACAATKEKHLARRPVASSLATALRP